MKPLIIYFDGLCPLCSREVDHYRKRAGDNVTLVDITAADFDARAHGLDPQRVHQVMHVRHDGQVRTGVDAFIAIWEEIPGHQWMARVARLPVLRQLLGVGYWFFAWLRPYLPRKKATCETGTCHRPAKT